MEAQAGYPPQGVPASGKPMERPTGVTILTVLYLILAIIYIAGPFIVLPIMGALLGEGLISVGPADLFATTVGMICFSVFLVFGLIYLLIAYGLLKGAGWARILALIFAILALINVPVGTILGIIVLYYLTRPQVKAWFQ